VLAWFAVMTMPSDGDAGQNADQKSDQNAKANANDHL
jgi:hypothetical protein